MSNWPFWSGLLAVVLAIGRFLDNFLDVLSRNIQRLLTIGLFIAILSHILHPAGVAVPDLLWWVPILNGSSPGH